MLPDFDTFIETTFPLLNRLTYRVTSPQDIGYNCIAWAAGINVQWWWPDPLMQYHWPPSVGRVCTVDAFIQAYATLGYAVCANGDFEPDFEKVAIYTDSQGVPTHASRQLDATHWTSKLGANYDIRHTLNELNGVQYGSPTIFLSRAR